MVILYLFLYKEPIGKSVNNLYNEPNLTNKLKNIRNKTKVEAFFIKKACVLKTKNPIFLLLYCTTNSKYFQALIPLFKWKTLIIFNKKKR